MENLLNRYRKDLIGGCGASENTAKSYIMDLRVFFRYLDDNSINFKSVTNATIRTYMIDSKGVRSIDTINRHLSSIKSFYTYLYETEELIEYNPTERSKPLKRTKEEESNHQDICKKEVLTKEEIAALKLTIKKEIEKFKKYGGEGSYKKNPIRDYAIVSILLATGCRIGEVCKLTSNDIGLINGTILFRDTKNGQTVEMDIDKKCIDAITKYLQIRDNEIAKCKNVFISRLGTPMSCKTSNDMIQGYIAEAGIDKHITNHCFRHTYATQYYNTCEDIDMVKDTLRHSDIKTTERYIHDKTSTIKKVKTEFSL